MNRLDGLRPTIFKCGTKENSNHFREVDLLLFSYFVFYFGLKKKKPCILPLIFTYNENIYDKGYNMLKIFLKGFLTKSQHEQNSSAPFSIIIFFSNHNNYVCKFSLLCSKHYNL